MLGAGSRGQLKELQVTAGDAQHLAAELGHLHACRAWVRAVQGGGLDTTPLLPPSMLMGAGSALGADGRKHGQHALAVDEGQRARTGATVSVAGAQE